MAIGNREVTDLPLLSAINGSDLYAVKSDQDYRVKVGGPNGLAYLDTTGRLASEFLQPNLATFDPNSKVDVANYNWNTLPNKPTAFPTDWANVASKPAFHAVATSGNYNDLTNKPTSMPPTAHTHAAGDVTSGEFDVARIPDLTQSKVTGLAAALDAKASLAGANFTGETANFLGAVGTQAIFHSYGWNNGISRWRWVIEPDASMSLYSYDAGGGQPTPALNIATAGAGGADQITFKGNIMWHAGNFNPASKASLGANVTFADITATRGDNSGVVYIGNAYLYNTGSTWQLSDHTTLSVGGHQVWTTNNFNPATKVNNGGSVATITKLTQAAYDALGTKDANTLYVIVG